MVGRESKRKGVLGVYFEQTPRKDRSVQGVRSQYGHAMLRRCIVIMIPHVVAL